MCHSLNYTGKAKEKEKESIIVKLKSQPDDIKYFLVVGPLGMSMGHYVN